MSQIYNLHHQKGGEKPENQDNDTCMQMTQWGTWQASILQLDTLTLSFTDLRLQKKKNYFEKEELFWGRDGYPCKMVETYVELQDQ